MNWKAFEGKTIETVDRARFSLRNDWAEDEAEGLVFTFSDGSRLRIECLVTDDCDSFVRLYPFQSKETRPNV